MTQPGEPADDTGAGAGGAGGGAAAGPPERAGTTARTARTRKQVLLRLDPAVHDALAAWAAGELRSTNAQIEFLLRRALAEAGRLPSVAGPIPRRGRPPKAGRPEPPAAPGAPATLEAPEPPAAPDTSA